jgi:hypothetical protein
MYVPYDEADHDAATAAATTSILEDHMATSADLASSAATKPTLSKSKFHITNPKLTSTTSATTSNQVSSSSNKKSALINNNNNSNRSANLENLKTREKMLELKAKLTMIKKNKQMIEQQQENQEIKDLNILNSKRSIKPILTSKSKKNSISSLSRPVSNIKIKKYQIINVKTPINGEENIVTQQSSSQPHDDMMIPDGYYDDDEDENGDEEDYEEYLDDEDDDDDEEEEEEYDEYDEDEDDDVVDGEDDYDEDEDDGAVGGGGVEEDDDYSEDDEINQEGAVGYEEDDELNAGRMATETGELMMIASNPDLLNHRHHHHHYESAETRMTTTEDDNLLGYPDEEENELLLNKSEFNLNNSNNNNSTQTASQNQTEPHQTDHQNHLLPNGLTDTDLMAIMMMTLNSADQLSLNGVSSSLATTALPTVLTPLYTTDNENFIIPYSGGGVRTRNRYLRRVNRRMPDGTISTKFEYVKQHNHHRKRSNKLSNQEKSGKNKISC